MTLLEIGKAADIVESENMVGMRMGEEYGVDALNAERQHLVAEIRWGIENEVLAACHDIQAAPAAFVFNRIGSAYVAGASNHGNSVRGAGA
jgi:hypothetical protein